MVSCLVPRRCWGTWRAGGQACLGLFARGAWSFLGRSHLGLTHSALGRMMAQSLECRGHFKFYLASCVYFVQKRISQDIQGCIYYPPPACRGRGSNRQKGWLSLVGISGP